MAPRVPEFGRFAEPSRLILARLTDGPKHGYAIMAIRLDRPAVATA